MRSEYATVQIALGAIVLLLALLFLRQGNSKKFQGLCSVGLMGTTGGLMASDLIGFWVGVMLFTGWFLTAGCMVYGARKRS